VEIGKGNLLAHDAVSYTPAAVLAINHDSLEATTTREASSRSSGACITSFSLAEATTAATSISESRARAAGTASASKKRRIREFSGEMTRNEI
jgi:hypothetical protein